MGQTITFDAKEVTPDVALPPATYVPRDVLAEGRRSAQVKDEQPASAINQWFETQLRPALEQAAHPHTLDDVVHLLMSPTDATRSLGTAIITKALSGLKSVAKAAPQAAIRATAAVGDAIDPDVVGVVSPRAGKVLTLAQRLRDKLTASSAAPTSPAAAPAAGPTAPAAAPAGSLAGLTTEEAQALQTLVQQGYREADVLRTIQDQRAAAAPTPSPAAPAPATAATPSATKPTLLAAESKEYMRLIKAGKSHKEAMELIVSQRALAQRLGLPSAEQARRAVQDRNASGHWRDNE